ncbi:MAG: DUF4349 domain-containing protein [Candidatus Nanohaloarchaea archaeon]|nr:DUF4349 domain-containing protein [Candidatus Nanohaloarchaea archaeon]
MDVQDLLHNRYVLAAAALIAVLVTGAVVQGNLSTSAAGQQLEATARYDKAVREMSGAAGGGAAGDAGGDSPATGRMRITHVSMDIDVPDVAQAQAAIEQMVDRYGGYTQDTSLNREFGDTGRMQVRVPVANRTVFTDGVAERWTVQSRETRSEDVTRRHTELTLELKNKRQELRRLEELMNRTDDVEHLITIQERMGELRTRIQYLENELTQLEERVEYATITISMEEASAFESRFELRRAVTDAYRGAFNSLNLIIVGTGYLLPFAVLFAVLYIGKRKWHES